jgi:hypothetical protein
MNGLTIAGAVGAGVAAGVGGMFVSRKLWDRWREHTINNRYAEDLRDKADLAKGSTWVPFPQATDERGYGDAFLPVLGVFAAGGAVAGASSLLAKGKTVPGIAVAGVAGLALGAVVGGIWGGTEGSRRAHAQHGIDIDGQVDELIDTWDQNGNRTLEIADTNGAREFLRRNPAGANYYTGAQDWLSIEQAMKHADTSGDHVVDAGELKALYASFDANHDGRLQEKEASAFSSAGNEYDALVESI